jgi:hypothetical protein
MGRMMGGEARNVWRVLLRIKISTPQKQFPSAKTKGGHFLEFV